MVSVGFCDVSANPRTETTQSFNDTGKPIVLTLILHESIEKIEEQLLDTREDCKNQ